MSAKDVVTPQQNSSNEPFLTLVKGKGKQSSAVYRLLDKVLHHLAGSRANNFVTYTNFCCWLHRNVDGAALGVFRLFYGNIFPLLAYFTMSYYDLPSPGLAMLIDLAEERGGGELEARYGKPMSCYFPLLNSIRPFDLQFMGAIYFCMMIGASGITLGYHFHKCCLLYIIPYWYIFLLDKSTWNNHSYLFGLVGTLLYFTNADRYW